MFFVKSVECLPLASIAITSRTKYEYLDVCIGLDPRITLGSHLCNNWCKNVNSKKS